MAAAHLEDTSGFFTRRGMVVGAILALHVFIAWALATGLANKALEAIAPPIQTVIETETHKAALMEFKKQLADKQPSLGVELGLMALDGKVQMFS